MQSTAYQQNTTRDAKKEAADPANDLFMRRVPQRLEAEGTLASLGPPALWAQELGVPPEKLGRLLILEDALLATGQRYNGPLTSEDPGPCLSH